MSGIAAEALICMAYMLLISSIHNHLNVGVCTWSEDMFSLTKSTTPRAGKQVTRQKVFSNFIRCHFDNPYSFHPVKQNLLTVRSTPF